MLTLHTSHKTEYLLAHLIKVIHSQPLPSAFDREVFLIQSQGMERWLSQELANEFGVWANADFLFPSKFFNSMANLVDVSLDAGPFERNNLIWQIDALLRNVDNQPVFAPLQNYLEKNHESSAGNSALRRYELAEQIARVFDEYQIMRPDMLDLWARQQLVTNNSAETWQMALWNLLLDKLQDRTQKLRHRGQIWQAAIEQLTNPSNPNLIDRLPKRISVFGISSMPPLFLEFLHALATQTDVQLFLMQPCKDYWADIPGIQETRLAKLTRNTFTETDLSLDEAIQNPLLSLLGQQGREFHQMLLERGDIAWTVDSFEDFSSEENSSTLTHLQDSILNNIDRPVRAQDNSIKVVACHSPMREIQVLKDYLLERLNQDAQLELRDIVVMAPDISNYEPFISAVFDDPRFAYSVADRSIRSANEILDRFIELLQLLSSRFEWDRVLDLLEQPVIYQKLGLNEEALDWIRTWVAQTHIRWGKDADHKSQMNLPALEQNTWDAGLKRMMEAFIQRGTGFDIEGSITQALGALDHFVRNILFRFSKLTTQERTLGQWQKSLLAMLESTFEENAFGHLVQLRELIGDLQTLPQTQSYPLDVIIHWLESSVGEQKSSQGFLSGQLTFCSILPMRSIPFKVICLIGLNENDFPKLDRKPSFDLMGGRDNFRTGDRSNRMDDRYQFLDALLSSRDAFYLSYVGQSIQSNREIPPSVVISEVLDALQQDENPTHKHPSLIEVHPLQPFSQKYFTQLQTFDAMAAETAKAFTNGKVKNNIWWDWENQTAEIALSETIALPELVSFFKDPQKTFVQKVAELRFESLEETADNAEIFTLDALENFTINHQILHAMLENSEHSLMEKLKTNGEWMQGTLGDVNFAAKTNEIRPLAILIQQQQSQLGAQLDERFIELKLNSHTLEGWHRHEYESGNLFYRPGKLKTKYLLEFWIYHLVNEKPTVIIGLNEKRQPTAYQFPVLPELTRIEYLNRMLSVYIDGHGQPSNLWIDAAWQYLNAKEDKQISNARTALDTTINGDHASEEVQLLTRGYAIEHFLNDEFIQLATEILRPVKENLILVQEAK